MELNIYWHMGCCDSFRSIDDFSPVHTGRTINNDEKRFGGKWKKMNKWRSFSKACPDCDAPAPMIFGRKFIIES